MCFPGGGTHNTRDMCSPGGGTHITRDTGFPGGGTHINRDMCFPSRGTHITWDMCFQGGGTYVTRDMCFPGGEHISLGICVPKKKSVKWLLLDQNDGLIPFEKCQFFDFLNFLFLKP